VRRPSEHPRGRAPSPGVVPLRSQGASRSSRAPTPAPNALARVPPRLRHLRAWLRYLHEPRPRRSEPGRTSRVPLPLGPHLDRRNARALLPRRAGHARRSDARRASPGADRLPLARGQEGHRPREHGASDASAARTVRTLGGAGARGAPRRPRTHALHPTGGPPRKGAPGTCPRRRRRSCTTASGTPTGGLFSPATSDAVGLVPATWSLTRKGRHDRARGRARRPARGAFALRWLVAKGCFYRRLFAAGRRRVRRGRPIRSVRAVRGREAAT
jgi:hypothetical protein